MADDDRVHEGSLIKDGRLDLVDWATLGALAVLASWIAAVCIWRAHRTGLTWTGTDGPFIGDQLQYLGWISDSADNGRIGNRFQLGPRAEGFVHPGLAISGLLHRLGLSTWLAYLAWKPVAVLALFFSARTYVRHFVGQRWGRRVSLVLALFSMPAIAHGAWTTRLGSSSFFLRAFDLDMWPGLYLWGYPFTAIAVALMPVALLAYERARTGDTAAWLPPLLCFGCSWLQPWQGSTVLAVVVVAEVIWWRRGPGRPWLLATTVGAGALPLMYYAVLSKVDASWSLAGQVNRTSSPPWWLVLVALTPIGLVALLELRRPLESFGVLALRLWPAAALAVYWTISLTGAGTFPLHAMQGLSIPMSILAVRGVAGTDRTTTRKMIVLVTVLMAAIYILVPLGRELHRAADTGRVAPSPWTGMTPYFIKPDERAALDHLRTVGGDGGVLSAIDLGPLVPGWSDRSTWVGIASWTPDFDERIAATDRLFSGALGPAEARAFVRSTKARFVLQDCQDAADLSSALTPIAREVTDFGCARIYDLGQPRR